MYFTEKFEKFLGIKMELDEQSSIDDLRKIPNNIIENARKLNSYYSAKYFLQFYLTERNWEFLPLFIEDIINGNDDILTWQSKFYLAPKSSLKCQLTKRLDDFYDYNYGPIECFLSPDIDDWKSNVSFTGAPLIYCSNTDYTFKSSENMYSLDGNSKASKIGPQSVTIIFRRWIATRIARMFYQKPEFLTFKNPEILEKFAPVAIWTNDALIAFQGLVREREEIGWAEDQLPGFIGPDEFYT